MTTSNAAAVDKTAEKAHEKLAEKRRALGRGLDALLPGPRVLPAAPTLPQSAQKDGAPAAASSQVPGLRSQEPAEVAGGRAGAAVATEAVPGRVHELQAAASGL